MMILGESNMFGYIYLTTNLINGKKYVGQHRSARFQPDKYIGSGVLLLKAIEKYGIENFKCELLESCNSDDELNEKEIYWIKKLNAVEDEDYYNLCKGGLGHTCDPWNKGKTGVQKRTPTMDAALEKGRHLPASPKLKQILSEYRQNVVVSEETRQKLSANQKGKKSITNGIENKYVFPEQLDFYLSNGWKLGKDNSLSKNKK